MMIKNSQIEKCILTVSENQSRMATNNKQCFIIWNDFYALTKQKKILKLDSSIVHFVKIR